MASVPDPLLRDGLAALAAMLPRGYSVALSNLHQPSPKGDAWVAIRNKSKQNALCLVLARRRVETRDLGAIAAHVARTRNPALLVSPYLSPAVRERLRGFGIGYWDLAGNAQIAVNAIDLCVERQGGGGPSKTGDCSARSLAGEMAGRVVRALVDLRPPYPIASLAAQAHVQPSCASRVIAFLGESGLVEREPRGKIKKVDWQEILRRWSLDSPLDSRGEVARFVASRGLTEMLARLAPSGFLHAITGECAFAHRASRPLPDKLLMYVNDTAEAVTQLGLHPSEDAGDIVLVKLADRSVFHRSYEKDGLRHVSPSLMAADLPNERVFEEALAWMSEHEALWRSGG